MQNGGERVLYSMCLPVSVLFYHLRNIYSQISQPFPELYSFALSMGKRIKGSNI